MKVIVAGRRQGKTTQLMKLFLADRSTDSFYVVLNHMQRQWLINEYQLNMFKSLRIIPCHMLPDYVKGHKDPRLYVDNADLILQYLLGARIDAATLTTEED